MRLLRTSGRKAVAWRPSNSALTTTEEVVTLVGRAQSKVIRPVSVFLDLAATVALPAWHCALLIDLSSA